MAASGEPELETPAKQISPKEQVSAKRKLKAASIAWTPKVATWVSVVLDKRSKRNLALQDVPAVVSRVDLESESVNVIYPNKLSHFLYEKGQVPQILFAIETHPMSKIQKWEGCTAQLDQVLIHAMLHFAERRGRALHGSQQIVVVASTRPELVTISARGESVDGQSVNCEKIKVGLRTLMEETRNDRTAPSSSSSKLELETPRKSDQGPSLVATLKLFTMRLSKLFQTQKSERLSRDDIREELSKDFPTWETLLVALDEKNQIMIAEDVVFRV